jgi:hypothetical protein
VNPRNAENGGYPAAFTTGRDLRTFFRRKQAGPPVDKGLNNEKHSHLIMR